MENNVPLEFDIKTASMRSISIILQLLDDNNINTPNDLNQRFNLFRSLFNNCSQYMNEKEKEQTEQVMNILREELNKHRRGQRSQFFYYGDIFEREMRTFAHRRINIGRGTL